MALVTMNPSSDDDAASSSFLQLYLPLVPLACISPDWFFRAVRNHLYPPDHLLVIERNHLDQKAAAKGLAPTGNDKRPSSIPLPPTTGLIGSKTTRDLDKAISESGASKQAMVKTAFDNQQRVNKGYVPPYDPQSQFYNVLSNGQMVASGPGAQGGGRNPVLQTLDAQFASQASSARSGNVSMGHISNPYRGKHPFGGVSSVSAYMDSCAGDRTSNPRMDSAAAGTYPLPHAAPSRSIDTTDPAQVIVANPHLTEPEAQILSAYASALDK
jgi:hypothetical protein